MPTTHSSLINGMRSRTNTSAIHTGTTSSKTTKQPLRPARGSFMVTMSSRSRAHTHRTSDRSPAQAPASNSESSRLPNQHQIARPSSFRPPMTIPYRIAHRFDPSSSFHHGIYSIRSLHCRLSALSATLVSSCSSNPYTMDWPPSHLLPSWHLLDTIGSLHRRSVCLSPTPF